MHAGIVRLGQWRNARHRFRFRSLRARDQRSQESAEAGRGARPGCRAARERRRGQGPQHRNGACGRAGKGKPRGCDSAGYFCCRCRRDRAPQGARRQAGASIEEKIKALAAKEAEVAAKEAQIAERDARITSLSEQLGAANAKAQLAATTQVVGATPFEGGGSPGEDPTHALAMFNMLGGVMGAFQQQVDDARQVGEQEGREAVQKDLEDMLNRARNDGYRDAMTYLDDRVTTAREAGAKEERARIANMGFFERRRYLKVHLT